MTTTYTYWKSTLTDAVYKFPAEMGIPKGQGWEPVHEETYIEYCKAVYRCLTEED